ncbi:TetR/AcrR family transcriptional regulator [Phenylobacterium sp. LjRoot164]|uniref:TetR/AcrR family transcriptional regulator n=1 Tax=unclassified Phenylobacterium TaxID=2640670 RepID=UPI003ECC9E9E
MSVALTRQQLYDRVWAAPMREVAAELGLSGGGLAKICDRLLIPYPPRGHWARAKAGRAAEPPPLPASAEPADAAVLTAGERSRARRRQTRAPAGVRRAQLLDAAAQIIVAEGLPAATLKSAARRVGLSEAQAHNHFPRRADLLVALARRELEAMEVRRRAELDQGHDRQDRVRRSTLAYLREVAERGALIQLLTASAEVRGGLRAEREAVRTSESRRVSEGLEAAYGLPPELAVGATRVLTAVTLRAGRLVASGRLPLEAAERLTLAMVEAGNRALVRAYRPSVD